MRVVVTGATGFMGGRLCAALADAGHDVRAFALPGVDVSGLPPAVEVAYGDVTDEESLVASFSGCDAVFHAAAAVEAWLPDPSAFHTIHQGESFCTEYEKSKFLADRIALQAAAEGVPITIVYPGIMYGPGTLTSGNLVCRVLIERFNGRLPGYIGHGYDRGSFSHVDDVVKGHIAAMEKGRVGERYLLTGENTSFVQIFNMAANLTNTKPPKFHIPLWLLAIYGWISVFVARITGKPPLISYSGVECLRHQWAYSCDKAKRELGYSPRSLSEGLAETLLWLKNAKLIKF